MSKFDQRVASSLSRFLDLWIPQRMNLEHIPGLSIGVISGGKLVVRRGYGFGDVEKKVKAKSETNYRIASISKMFTTVALLQLAEQKKLHLDDSVNSYLPWLKARKAKRDAKDITIRQVLSHTSGLWRDGRVCPFVTDKFPKRKKLQEAFSEDALIFATLEQFKYSNFAFALLSEVIGGVSGEEYPAYINTHILQPLKMQNTAADLKDDIPNFATGYGRFIPGEKRDKFSQIKTNAYASAAGVISNVEDLARFFVFLSSEDDTGILGKTSKREMKRIQVKTGDEGDRFYGLGTIITERGNQRFFGHSGGFQGFATTVLSNQKSGISVIVLTNSIDAWSDEIALGIHNVFSRMKEEEGTNKQIPSMRKFEGYYRNRWGDIVVVQAGNKLIARSPFESLDEKIASLVPTSKNEFRIEGVSNFDSVGEHARFTKEKGKDILWWGALPFRKISPK